MAAVTYRGNATIEGIPGSFDVIAWWLPQTGRFADNWEKETIKDVHGFDTALLGRNQHIVADIGMKICGMNGAAKASLLTQAWPLAPLTKVTLSNFVYTVDASGGGGLNGAYTTEPGSDLNLSFDKVNEATFKLLKYVDPAQNALLSSTPT